jgi:hypothetical protein
LGATFSELIGQPTPLEFRAFAPTTAALVTGTIETIPSSVALTKPPLEAIATVSSTQGQASVSASTS